MTDAQKMLALARAVYGQQVGIDDNAPGLPGKHVYVCPEGKWSKFDPANNADQFVEVLAWLLRQDKCNDIDGHCVRVYPTKDKYRAITFKHDGTAAGLRQAVTDAAVRVAGVEL